MQHEGSGHFVDLPAFLDSPPHLCCPLTHDLFLHPVITEAGQIYERKAIEQVLLHNGKDPITQTPLVEKKLTPVYALRSQALEFREQTARSCVQAACSSNCPDPIRFLRRAVELAAEAGLRVEGLSQECMAYVEAHTSNAYDESCLRKFAAGLLAAGLQDEAATVFYGLLQRDGDRAQQAELLRKVLECWTAELRQPPDEATFRKLAHFMEVQQAFSWLQIVEVVRQALGDALTLQLCEHLLLRGSSDHRVESHGAQWQKQKELLVKYVQVYCMTLAQQMRATALQVERLQEITLKPDPAAQPQNAQQKSPSPKKGQGRRHRDSMHRAATLAAKVAVAGLSLTRNDHLLVRVGRVAPLLWLLRHA